MIELGQKVKDMITGFEGIVTAKIEYLNGCLQFYVVPKAGKPTAGEAQTFPKGKYLDFEQLKVIGKGKIKLQRRTNQQPSGGIRAHPF